MINGNVYTNYCQIIACCQAWCCDSWPAWGSNPVGCCSRLWLIGVAPPYLCVLQVTTYRQTSLLVERGKKESLYRFLMSLDHYRKKTIYPDSISLISLIFTCFVVVFFKFQHSTCFVAVRLTGRVYGIWSVTKLLHQRFSMTWHNSREIDWKIRSSTSSHSNSYFICN